MPTHKKRSGKKRKRLGLLSFIGLLLYYALYAVWAALKAFFSLLTWLIRGAASKARRISRKRRQPHSVAAYEGFAEVMALEGSLTEFEGWMLGSKSRIGIILGARGTGKSALGLRILENIHANTNKRIYAMGFLQADLPPWIEVIDSIEGITSNAVVLLDEGGIEFSSREAMSGVNKLLSALLLISRHKDLSILFITQNSANLEVNAIRQADFLLMKPSSLLQMDFERKGIRERYREVEGHFSRFRGKKGLTYAYSDHYRGFVTNSLPSFWSEKVSKAYMGNEGVRAAEREK